MTRVLLDTHAVIWLVVGHERLGNRARGIAEDARAGGLLYVSAMSFWEIGMLMTKDRIDLDRPMLDWRRRALAQGIEEIPLTGGTAMICHTLEGLPNDPADRIIVATALNLDATLVTADGRLLRWDGELERHNARL